jgi:hypothetical protein
MNIKYFFRRFTSTPAQSSFRERLREYGPVSVGVYVTLTFTFFSASLASITLLGVDMQKIQNVFDRMRETVGLQKAPTKDSNDLSWLPEWFRNPIVTQVLMAMALTKLFLPIKLGLTAFLTPMVARRLRSLGFNLRDKGGLRDAGVRVRQRYQDRMNKKV